MQISRRRGCRGGLAFIGRGFTVRVEAPAGGDIAVALGDAAGECIDACPTGALACLEDNG